MTSAACGTDVKVNIPTFLQQLQAGLRQPNPHPAATDALALVAGNSFVFEQETRATSPKYYALPTSLTLKLVRSVDGNDALPTSAWNFKLTADGNAPRLCTRSATTGILELSTLPSAAGCYWDRVVSTDTKHGTCIGIRFTDGGPTLYPAQMQGAVLKPSTWKVLSQA